jgi:hypothetical protein
MPTRAFKLKLARRSMPGNQDRHDPRHENGSVLGIQSAALLAFFFDMEGDRPPRRRKRALAEEDGDGGQRYDTMHGVVSTRLWIAECQRGR